MSTTELHDDVASFDRLRMKASFGGTKKNLMLSVSKHALRGSEIADGSDRGEAHP